MLKKLFVALLLVIFVQNICHSQTVQSDTTTYKNLIGNRLDSLSKSLGFKSEAFGVIGDEFSEGIKHKYGIKVFGVSKQHLVLFLEANWKNDKANYVVKDQILLQKPGSEYSIAIQMCKRNDKRDSSIFAVAKDKDETYLTDIIAAWKIDFDTQKINHTIFDGIKCERMFSVN